MQKTGKHPLDRRFFFIALCLLSLDFVQTGRAAVNAEAYLGEPFGVGRVTIDVLRGEPLLPLSDERFTVEEIHGRVMYPALQQQPVRQLLRDVLDLEAPRRVTIYYLFRGDQPFDLSAYTPYEQGVRVKPQRNAARHKQLLNAWWEQYNKSYESLLRSRAYPPVAENFLIASLSRRLDLPIPKSRPSLLGLGFIAPLQIIDTENSLLSDLIVNEDYRLRVDRELLAEANQLPDAMVPLPDSFVWPESEIPDDSLKDVVEEPLAAHVPAECFYIRFGNFLNYLWFRDLNKKWQGDLGNMVLLRGVRSGTGKRIEQQLSLRESVLAKVLGPQVIADAAIIGLDHHVAEGAAIGILFQAKNDFLLAADLTKQRQQALTNFADAKETTIELEGISVSLIATPDGRVRSYYVQQDTMHLVTTSRTLATRFLQASRGDRSLADLPSFRRARQDFPVRRDDTIFAFVSEEYWRNLCTPHYFIENLRRVSSAREPLLLELAEYSAACEGVPGKSKKELIEAEIIPSGFGFRVDGSEMLTTKAGFVDSLRGTRGFYVPIADLEVGEVSQHEAQLYHRFAQQLGSPSSQLPPVVVTVQRTPNEDPEIQTISVEFCAQGSLRPSLGKVAGLLGQPATQRLQPIAGDLLSVEAVVELPASLAGSDAAEQHLFGALRDFRSPLVVRSGKLEPDAPPTELVRGYLGAWPKPGILAWFTGGEVAQGPEPEQVGDAIWQAKIAEFLLISFKSEVIQQVLPQLAMQPVERAAQLWVRLEELTNTLMAENANAMGYMRTRETSAAASRLMNSLANQLHVPRDQCKSVAEQLIDGEFVCALGGQYQLYAPERGLEVWVSTALPERNRFLLNEVPEDFTLPLLTWFRGLRGELRLDERALRAKLEINMTKAALP